LFDTTRLWWCALLVASLHAAARADDVLPSIDARTFRPSVDPRAQLASEPAMTPGPWAWNVGMDLHLSHAPIVLKDSVSHDVAYRPLIAVFGGDFIANVGIGKRAALGVALPVVFAQGSGNRPLPDGVQTAQNVPISAIGDLSLRGKGTFIKNDGGGLGLAALLDLTVPTGARTSYAGEGSVTGSLRLLAEYSVIIANAQASLGYFFRTERRTWPSADLGGVRFGDEIPWSFALIFHPGIIKAIDSQSRQSWELGVHGWIPAGPVGPFVDPGAAALSPVLLSTSDRIALGHDHDVYVMLGAEFGLTQAVGVPIFRSIVSVGWTPRDHDKDGDGIPDDLDQCPDIPEDKDGFEDTDGCPELDNDEDGIIDREDACPNVRGVPSTDRHKNGCPAASAKDSDNDGIPDSEDKCPTEPEDKDGVDDEDGCPDPDNDKDGIPDKDDACPNVFGDPSPDKSRNGCPNPDRDGDTYPNDKDECPDAAEVFNGVKDEDGCPDEGGKPLVVIDKNLDIKLAGPIKFTGAADAPEIDPSSMMILRALALEMNRHADYTLMIGAKGATEQTGLLRAIAVTGEMSRMIQRDGAAESVGWDAVKKSKTADSGVGFVILQAPKKP